MREQVPSQISKFSPLRGTEAERQAASDIDPEELNVTTDQKRWFLGTTHVPPSAHHDVANEAARLALNSSSARGCWEGDTAKQSDDGRTYKCIAGNGTSAGEWVVLGSPVDAALSASSDNAVENRVVKTALDGKSDVGHTHSYSSLTGIPSSFVPEGHTHTLSEITDSGTAAGLNVPSSGNAASGEVVKGDDTRLSDSRSPTSHSHLLSDVTDSGTAAGLNVPSSGDAASGEVVKGDDTRLSDSRSPTSHSHLLSDVTDSGSAAGLNVPSSGNAAAGEVVKGDDTRLSDSRSPTSHSHLLSDVTDSGTAAGLNVPSSGNAASGEVVKGNDSRLTDSRPPQSHAHTLDDVIDAGSAAGLDVPSSGDAASGEVVKGNDSRLSDSRSPTSHNHLLSDVTDAGSAAGLDVPSSGDAASGEVVKGNDSRLSDARTPTSHTHSYNDLTDKPTIPDGLPEGSVIGWVSSIGAVSVPAFDSSKWKKCEGGSITGGTYNGQSVPDYRDHFLRGSATSSDTSQGSDTHSHTISEEVINPEADAGNCTTVRSLTSGTTSTESNVPKHKTVIYLLKYA